MSFSFEVKEELCKIDDRDPSCRLAEFYGMILFGQLVEQKKLKITTENVLVINRLQGHCAEIPGTFFYMEETMNSYSATMEDEALKKLYDTFKIAEKTLEIEESFFRKKKYFSSFLRGAVLSGGYFSAPQSGYHFELVTPYYSLAKSALAVLKNHDISCKMVVRRSNYVVYLKDSQQIYNLLYTIGARSCAFDLMNIKIEKETNNNNNRIDNCAAYNMDKALNKAVEQIRAIERIESSIGFGALAPDLTFVAQLRKQNPTKSLTELANIAEGKISKPGLSRKLNKIIDIAKNIKEST